MAREHDPSAPEDHTLADSLLAEPEETVELGPEPEPTPPSGRVKGLGRVFRGNRAVWITALVAAICLVGGLLVGRFVLSPADAAARASAPNPGYITVAVEYGELSNDVTLRGQVGYADAVEVKLAASELADASVATGHVPDVGDELDAGDIALEIAGRPVFVLPGQLPAYRTLRMGMSGPDVSQLKKALNALDIKAGKGDTFDETLAEAIRQLYTDSGYTAAVDADAAAGVRAARESVRQADEGITAARKALRDAGAPSSAVKKQWNNQVNAANREVTVAKKAWDAARDAEPADPVAIASAKAAWENAKDNVALVKAQRKEALKKPDTSDQKAALKAAEQRRTDAGKELTKAKKAALPFLPAAEVLYLTELPRRVDQVLIERGGVISGPVMSVSGATVELSGSAANSDAKLLTIGDEAFFELPDGTEHRAVISKIEPDPGGGRATITFAPDPLETEMIQQIQGSNVRVKVAVGATEGKVLSVPFAALTAGPGGESRVEVVEGDPRDENATTRLVVVTPGLAAGGYVEVTPTEGQLKEGDLVVVGA
ncbi:MAG: hypothetical protein LCH76_00530 [Actinobacteria bacterium]|nr:hypothetical protein [Actinomycetota bacterium]